MNETLSSGVARKWRGGLPGPYGRKAPGEILWPRPLSGAHPLKFVVVMIIMAGRLGVEFMDAADLELQEAPSVVA